MRANSSLMDAFVAEIIMELARIHQDLERLRLRLNPIPDLITFASNNVAAQLKQYVRVIPSEDASDTVYVNLQVDLRRRTRNEISQFIR